MISRIANNSISEGRSVSRLPKFSDEWIEKIRGSSDFLALNYYTSRFIKTALEPAGDDPSFEQDGGFVLTKIPKSVKAASPELTSVPEGLGDLLRYKNT